MRSASSRIRVSTARQSKFSSLIYCSRRPVVATTMSWFSLNTSAWFMYATPPVMVAMSRWVCFASSRAWSATCIASSRVGVRIRMRGGPDFLRGKSSRCCNAGSRYAAVLPVPVGAEPRMSLTIERRRNSGGLNGCRASETLSSRLPAGFRRVQVRKKSLQSCSTSEWAADYRRY